MKKSIALFGLATALSATALFTQPAQASSCGGDPYRALNIAGKYLNDVDETLRVTQNGCKSARLEDLVNGITYDFPLDGKTEVQLPKAFLDIIARDKPEYDYIQHATYTATLGEDGYGQKSVKISMKARIRLPAIGGGKVYLDATADGVVEQAWVDSLDGHGNVKFRQALELKIHNVRVSHRREGDSSLHQMFARGANTVLSALDGFIANGSRQVLVKIQR